MKKAPDGSLSPTPFAAGEVHVWKANLESPLLRSRALEESLSSDERRRAAGFVFDRDRASYAAGRAILRVLLSRYVGLRPEELRFAYGPRGKPHLADAKSAVSFSLSHSGGVALYAFCGGAPIGADIERVRSDIRFLEIARRFFAENEAARIAALPSDEIAEAFFACWTRKEAFAKATGQGLFYDLRRFEVSFLPDKPPRILRISDGTGNASDWSLLKIEAGADHRAAVAVRQKNARCLERVFDPAVLEPCAPREWETS